jgi:hypothetical protein
MPKVTKVNIMRKVAEEKVITLYFMVSLQQTYIGIENILLSSLYRCILKVCPQFEGDFYTPQL